MSERTTSEKSASRISGKSISQNVKNASYAVRGPIVSRSMEISNALKTEEKGSSKYPFDRVISCNIGNPHALGQGSISFVRDVLSMVVNPNLLSASLFTTDAVERAKKYLSSAQCVGAYSESQGFLSVREEISDFLHRRDGYPSDPNDIFLTNGASEGVRFCMQTIIRDPSSGFRDGVLTPIPQYPLYSALTTLLQGHLVPYLLDESTGWSCTSLQLSAALAKADSDGICVRALVVINPGNPTGQILSEENMIDIVRFCVENHICLMADEVYQENVWREGSRFHSFRKVAMDMKAFDGPEPLQLVSFHSVSKGFLGECGLRGGYYELLGFPEEVKAELLKLASISLCSNTIGQIVTGLMVNPPKEGEDSHPKYVAERDAILASLRRRATRMTEALNTLEGVSCTAIEGAMYAFPTIRLPEKAIRTAKERNIEPDALYCIELLENTGIVVVPGSGFGQKEGTHHFRTTILPPEDSISEVVSLLQNFHANFLSKYKGDGEILE